MRKVSEVCRITGVTQKTLREYEKVGFVLPTNHNERKEGSGNGYRFYDDEAILKIINAKMLMEAGYCRLATKIAKRSFLICMKMI